MTITGPAGAIVSAERTALNFLGHMSGIATLTSKFVKKARLVNSSVEIYDTRKTLPGLRVLEKYAVTAGGGKNHRMSLSDQVLIKENHIALEDKPLADLIGGFVKAVKKGILVEVEVENISQLREVLDTGADIIMLDNFTVSDITEARKMARLVNGEVKLEVSGGITLNNVAAYASTGIDRISVGRLTMSAPALDYTLLMEI
jgi:nicotinate-nucleotide pyrophosphorylase (carboxylating)